MAGFKKRQPGEWGVRDKNARQLKDDGSGQVQPRFHEVRAGVQYGLVYDKPLYMPEADARVFLKDEAFVVTDENDNPVQPLAATALLRTAPTKLAPNMVVADLNELTDEALLTRAAQITGSGAMTFTTATPRELLVRYLTAENGSAGATRGRSASAPVDDDDAAELEDMDPDAVARALEGS
jgi:hypothetical protein